MIWASVRNEGRTQESFTEKTFELGLEEWEAEREDLPNPAPCPQPWNPAPRAAQELEGSITLRSREDPPPGGSGRLG